MLLTNFICYVESRIFFGKWKFIFQISISRFSAPLWFNQKHFCLPVHLTNTWFPCAHVVNSHTEHAWWNLSNFSSSVARSSLSKWRTVPLFITPWSAWTMVWSFIWRLINYQSTQSTMSRSNIHASTLCSRLHSSICDVVGLFLSLPLFVFVAFTWRTAPADQNAQWTLKVFFLFQYFIPLNELHHVFHHNFRTISHCVYNLFLVISSISAL